MNMHPTILETKNLLGTRFDFKMEFSYKKDNSSSFNTTKVRLKAHRMTENLEKMGKILASIHTLNWVHSSRAV